MTAIVGILNKRSVALAADSAITIDGPNGHKVLNSANKLFNISRRHPVGLMMYSSATFMDTPWELIIKTYRDYLKYKCFPTLQEYVDDFIKYLKEKHFFCSSDLQKCFLLRHMIFYYEDVLKIAIKNCVDRTGESPDKIPLAIAHEEMLKVLSEHTSNFSKYPKSPDFKDYTLESFRLLAEYATKEIESKYAAHVRNIEEFRDAFLESFFTYLCSNHIVFDHTGLVFVGYGNDEIYPSLIPLNVAFAIDGKLRYSIDVANAQHISEKTKAAICPFAQTDVMMTILTGIDRGIQELTYNTLDSTIANLLKTILANLLAQGVDQTVIHSLTSNVDPQIFIGYFKKTINDYITHEYIKKLVETVEYLDKEDLANVAENLISLTGLKRRMTSSEESVGGPVDVALISKCDGFIWMKRKHYFKRDLNEQFFQRYK